MFTELHIHHSGGLAIPFARSSMMSQGTFVYSSVNVQCDSASLSIERHPFFFLVGG